MPLPANITAAMSAPGGAGPIALIDIVTRTGAQLFVSDQAVTVPSWITGAPADYQPWLSSAVKCVEYRDSRASTCSFSLTNLAGDTVMRSLSRLFSMNELTGAMFFYRLWLSASEAAIYSFLGKLNSPSDDGDSFSCSGTGLDNWSMIKAPPFRIDVACPLDFGGVACGSTSGTPCSQDYASCSSIERFAGAIVQWNGATLSYTQLSQPAQSIQLNNQRPF